MTKTLTALAVLSLTFGASSHASDGGSKAPSVSTGNTTEVRYFSPPSSRKGKTVNKLDITRDSSGRIISVKKG